MHEACLRERQLGSALVATRTLQPRPTYQYRDCPLRFSMERPIGLPLAPKATDKGASITTFSGPPPDVASATRLRWSCAKVSCEGSPSPARRPQLFEFREKPGSTKTHSPDERVASSVRAARMGDMVANACIGGALLLVRPSERRERVDASRRNVSLRGASRYHRESE